MRSEIDWKGCDTAAVATGVVAAGGIASVWRKKGGKSRESLEVQEHSIVILSLINEYFICQRTR